MELTRSLLDALLDSLEEPIYITNRDGRIVQVNAAFEHATGYRAGAALGETPSALCHERHGEAFWSAVEAALQTSGKWSGTVWHRHAGGQEFPTSLSVRTYPAEAGQSAGWIGVLRPHAATPAAATAGAATGRDSLTGLPTRDLFLDRLEQAISAAPRDRRSVAVIAVGIDGLTHINDGLGYEVGDELLGQVALRLQQSVRRSDTVARLDGDRFAMIMPMRADDDAVLVTQKVLDTIRRPFTIGGADINATASMGVSIFPTDGAVAVEILSHAMSAMSFAKQSGRNLCQFYSNAMNERAMQRIRLETQIRRALATGEFILHYQPKIDVETGAVVGAEALVRWQHPQRGLVAPGEFIPAAEHSGQIVPLGLWVLREACRQNVSWQTLGLKAIRVSVNVSPRQFWAHDLVDEIAAALRETGMAPAHLELEITEGLLMGEVERSAEKLDRLHRLGVHLSLDDFGTGYSSLSYLGRFPISTIKIDRSFVRDLERNRVTAEITRAIIGLSRGLALEVVAEGAETREHVAFLRQHGCHMVQGFYYSRPLPPDDFEAVLRVGFLRPEVSGSGS
ncbi:MAG: EAL domain-containing protein [Candidatus Schekmanbacteria bacterium]|nr:EAL domain-containing protein [Candidatus Schekmanbacteria bacterium]